MNEQEAIYLFRAATEKLEIATKANQELRDVIEEKKDALLERIIRLEQHLNYQIDEDRKVNRRMDEHEALLELQDNRVSTMLGGGLPPIDPRVQQTRAFVNPSQSLEEQVKLNMKTQMEINHVDEWGEDKKC